jgi:glycosyltransferase involved in cell wall biosynthesis
MRILLVNYEYPPVGGGAATATEAIAKALVGLGHYVVILTARFKGWRQFSESDGVVVHRVPSLRRKMDRSGIIEMASFMISGLIVTPAVIRKHRIEGSIAFFSLPCGPISWLGRWMCGASYVVSLRGGDVPGNERSLNLLHRFLTPLRRAVLNNALAIAANSDGLRKLAEAVDPFPVRVIPNGVDTDFFVPGQPKTGTNNGKILRILFVGRFQAQKNLAYLLRQLAQVSPARFELHLVGDGPDKQALQCLAQQLGIAGTITWHGWLTRDAVRDEYQAADCLVNPSLYEGMSNVVLEAMACGLPVVASRIAGNEELVVDGETGFLFDLQSPDDLKNALQQLVNDRELCVRLGTNARAQIATRFRWRDAAQAYLQLFFATT